MEFSRVFRYVQIIAATLILAGAILITSQTGQYKIAGITDKGLYNEFLIHTDDSGVTMSDCLALCLRNCSCLSFEMNGVKCELYKSSTLLYASAVVSKPGTTSFTIEQQNEVNQKCGKGCLADVNCCLKDQPCQNGGLCLPADPEATGRRFRCKCNEGTAGERCEISPRVTCQDYIHGIANSLATYKKFSDGNNLFCHFDKTTGIAWTMVMSYTQENSRSSKSLNLDDPHNEFATSYNFDKYRLSRTRMTTIRDASKKWRVTCQFNNYIDQPDSATSRDHVIGLNDELDFLADQAAACPSVESVKIRAYACSPPQPCKMKSVQGSEGMMYFSFKDACLDTAYNNMYGTDKQYFGVYARKDSEHSCATTETTTTQIWFGG